MIRRPPRSTQSRSSAASDVYKRQPGGCSRATASSITPGMRSTTPSPTSWTCTWAACVASSTSPARPAASRHCAAPATSCAPRKGSRRAVDEPRSPDVFARARFRLALLFAGIVVILVVVSGVITYLNVRSDLQTAARGAFSSGETEQEFVTRSLSSFRWRLLAVDGAIILAVGVGGLLYARSTLRPIRDNVAAQKRFIADASHELRTPAHHHEDRFRGGAARPGARPGCAAGAAQRARGGRPHDRHGGGPAHALSLIHISEPTRLGMISYAV